MLTPEQRKELDRLELLEHQEKLLAWSEKYRAKKMAEAIEKQIEREKENES